MGADGPLDSVEQYRAYLERYEALAGPGDFGQFVKRNGRLIKKMRFDEFEAKWGEWMDVSQAYSDSIAAGDTINDLVVKILRERANELLVEPPAAL